MNNLKLIKSYLKKNNIYGYLIPKNNEYFNEFISPEEDELLKVSGFTGSAGFSLITEKKNNIYVDGRYTEQASKQCKRFSIKDIGQLKKDLLLLNKKKQKILINPRLFTDLFFDKKYFDKKFLIFHNSINKIKKNNDKAFLLREKFSGLTSSLKIKKIHNLLKLEKKEAFFITSCENLGWLSNTRSYNKKFSYILNGLGILNNKKLIFYSKHKLNIKNKDVIYKNLNQFKDDIKKFSIIYYDSKTTSIFYQNLFEDLNIKNKILSDPIYFEKSKKNKTEISNLQIAHLFDSVAYIKFLFWLKNNISKNINEIQCQKKIEFYKRKNPYYLGQSFPTISAFDKNASIIHYNALNFKKTFIKKNSTYLFDSGSQYLLGTTDMTRTVSTGQNFKYIKKIYTLILKGHIAVSTFNLNKKSLGINIDKKARFFLKKEGLDYNHGTGHGVGYLANVHENPPSISKLSRSFFYEGNVVSNEPGFYKKKYFGIRLENLLFVSSQKKRMYFKNLTLVPFDKNLILKKLLNQNEINWINNYHNEVFLKNYKFLNNQEKNYLKELCLNI